MPRAVQAVFLVDIASLHGYDDNLLHDNFLRSVNCIRYSCLKFLTCFGTRKTRWGYKFYCSNGLIRQKMNKRPFSEFNLESFEEFEDELLHRYERYNAACNALDRTTTGDKPRNDAPCNVVKIALTQLASEYNWDAPEIASPVKRKPAKRRKLSDGDDEDDVFNCVFHFSRIPRSYEELDVFLGKSHAGVDIAKELMPPQLQRLLIGTLRTRFVWIDSNPTTPSDLEEFRAAITKLNGNVTPFQVLMKSCGTTKDEGSSLYREPFSSLAQQYLHKETSPPLSNGTLLVLGDEEVCRLECCFDSSAESDQAFPCLRQEPHWEEIKLLYRASSILKQCALNSERLLGYRPDSSGSATSSERLATVLRNVSVHEGAFVVELSSSRANCVSHGFLIPVNDFAFCVHIVTVLSSLPVRSLKETSFEFPTGDVETVETALKPFDATVLEHWYIPPAPTSTFLASFSESDAFSKKRERLLEKLREEGLAKSSAAKGRVAKDVKAKSDQSTVPSNARTLKKRLSASLNVSSRSADMVAHSYIRTRKEATSAVAAQPSGTASTRSRSSAPLHLHSIADEAQLIKQLKSSLEAALNSGSQTSLLTCAQNVVGVLKHHCESSASAPELLDKNFISTCAQIAQKYSGSNDPVCKQRRLLEHQFQVLLALEKELHFKLSVSACVEDVVSSLRTMSFIYSPLEANQFLRGPIRDNYLISLRDVVLEISEELNVPLFSETPSSGTFEREFSDLDSLPSVSSVPSHDSYLSSIPSLPSQRPVEKGESRTITRMDLSQPSMQAKRQIVVSKTLRNRHARAQTSNPSKAAIKTEPVRAVRRGLFVSPTKKPVQPSSRQTTPKKRRVLKTTFVPETPAHKQGGQVVRRRQERMRKRSGVEVTVRVVCETPQKLLPDEASTTPSKSPRTPTRTRLRCTRSSAEKSITLQNQRFAEDANSRTPTKPSPTSVSTPTRSILKNKFAVCSDILPSVAHVTPRKCTQQGVVEATPPHWNGSESLFSTPGSVAAASENTPRKSVAFADFRSERPQTTPRRRISKRLLHSPSTPKTGTPARVTPSKSELANPLRNDTSRQLFRTATSKSLASEDAEEAIASSKGCRRKKRTEVRAPISEVVSNDSGVHSSNGGSSNGTLKRKGRKNQRAWETAENKEFAPDDEQHPSECAEPWLHGLEGVPRITRSKAKETGLTPHEIFVLSQTSPSKGEPSITGLKTALLGAQTPQHVKPQKRTFTPPSAISLLHLTSSPMLMHAGVE